MSRAAILQSNYIPWKGYFDLIASVDTFILYDDMQYTKRDWRNRNKIKTPSGLTWLSVPVKVKGKYLQKINEVEVSDVSWSMTHWNQITQHYRKAAYFDDIAEWLEPLYMNRSSDKLSDINRLFIEAICSYLNIDTTIRDSREFDLVGEKTERLAGLCTQIGATEYISGPAAKDYIDRDVFEALGIKLSWADYSGYKEYQQLWGSFVHSVTILDLLFNVGPESNLYMNCGAK